MNNLNNKKKTYLTIDIKNNTIYIIFNINNIENKYLHHNHFLDFMYNNIILIIKRYISADSYIFMKNKQKYNLIFEVIASNYNKIFIPYILYTLPRLCIYENLKFILFKCNKNFISIIDRITLFNDKYNSFLFYYFYKLSIDDYNKHITYLNKERINNICTNKIYKKIINDVNNLEKYKILPESLQKLIQTFI
jgi:hypothetical protein